MNLLDKRTDAQTFIIEQRPLIAILLGYAASRQSQAGKPDIGRCHENHSAAVCDLIRDIELLQF